MVVVGPVTPPLQCAVASTTHAVRYAGRVDSSVSKEALCVAAEWRCYRAPFSQSHGIVLSSPQPTAA